VANVSRWKDWEKEVANALGGKRRFRTTESYGKIADDVKFSKKMRRLYPKLKTVAIECKKRKSMNIHALFAEALLKYCTQSTFVDGKRIHASNGKHLILASKVTRKRTLHKEIRALKRKMMKRKKGFNKRLFIEKREQIRLRHSTVALVTVELDFFKELWQCWLYQGDLIGGTNEI
jgi:hypothetical protein